jgi:hypothetical protein
MLFLPSRHDNYGILTVATWVYSLPMPKPKPANSSAEVVALLGRVVGARWVLNEQMDTLSR